MVSLQSKARARGLAIIMDGLYIKFIGRRNIRFKFVMHAAHCAQYLSFQPFNS